MIGATIKLNISANIDIQLNTAPRMYAISNLFINISVKLQLRSDE